MASYSIDVSILSTAETAGAAEGLALGGLVRYVRAHAVALGVARQDVAGLPVPALRAYAAMALRAHLLQAMLHDITVSADEARTVAIAQGAAAGGALTVVVEGAALPGGGEEPE